MSELEAQVKGQACGSFIIALVDYAGWNTLVAGEAAVDQGYTPSLVQAKIGQLYDDWYDRTDLTPEGTDD